MFRWIVDDTRALIDDIRRWIEQLNRRVRWSKLRSRQRVERAAAELENVRRSAESRTRMCRECRALVPVDARVCPECGESPGRKVTTGVTRVLENMLPGFLSASSSLLTINMLAYAMSSLVYQQLRSGLPEAQRDLAWLAAVIGLGANQGDLVASGQVWRLVTMMFLHGNLIHLLMNSWALLAVAPLLEELYGSRKFIVLYLLTGLGGSLASAWSGLGSPRFSVGASGALFGLIGVAAVWGWRRGGRLGEGIRGQMVQWALYGLVMGFLIPNVDNSAHIGGLITGAAAALVIGDAAPRTNRGAALWSVVSLVCVLLVLLSFGAALMTYDESVSWAIRAYSRMM